MGFILLCVCWGSQYWNSLSASELSFLILFCSCSFNRQQQTVAPFYEWFCNQCPFFLEIWNIRTSVLRGKSLLFNTCISIFSVEFVPIFRVILETLAPTWVFHLRILHSTETGGTWISDFCSFLPWVCAHLNHSLECVEEMRLPLFCPQKVLCTGMVSAVTHRKPAQTGRGVSSCGKTSSEFISGMVFWV